jgi:hypothetical protein
MEQYPQPNAIYKHYKGGLYKVLHLAKHTETNEVLVIYQSIHFGSFHARPLSNWNSAPEETNNNWGPYRFKIESSFN